METVDLLLSNCRAYFLVSGAANLLAAFVWIFVGFLGGLLTCGLGCLLLFMPIIHLAISVFDFTAVSKMGLPPAAGTYSFLRFTAILDIVALFAILPPIIGILNLQLLARPEIYDHFHGGSPART